MNPNLAHLQPPRGFTGCKWRISGQSRWDFAHEPPQPLFLEVLGWGLLVRSDVKPEPPKEQRPFIPRAIFLPLTPGISTPSMFWHTKKISNTLSDTFPFNAGGWNHLLRFLKSENIVCGSTKHKCSCCCSAQLIINYNKTLPDTTKINNNISYYGFGRFRIIPSFVDESSGPDKKNIWWEFIPTTGEHQGEQIPGVKYSLSYLKTSAPPHRKGKSGQCRKGGFQFIKNSRIF